MKILILIFSSIIIISLFFYSENKKQEEIDKIGLVDLNLKLEGIIDSVDAVHGYNGYGVIRLKILSSNINSYDPRNKLEFYFCIIKNGYAEIYTHAFGYLIGDTLKFNTKDKIMVYKNEVGSISINSNIEYYNYLRKHHQKL